MKNSKAKRLSLKRKRGAEGRGTSNYAMKNHKKKSASAARNAGYFNPGSPFKAID